MKNTQRCNPEQSLLLLVDIQQRLVPAMDNQSAESMLRSTGNLLQAASLLQIPVAVSEQYPEGLGHTIPPLQKLLPDSTTITGKTVFSAVKAPEFSDFWQQQDRQQIIVTGLESHICVIQTVLDLLELSRTVFVVVDAICSRTRENQEIALQRMQHAGAILISSESVLFEWLSDAKHPHFKAISKLIL